MLQNGRQAYLGLIQGTPIVSIVAELDEWSGLGLKQISTSIRSPDPEETPLTSTGDAFEFQGGTISSYLMAITWAEDYDGNTWNRL
jgi:hypothetical protein